MKSNTNSKTKPTTGTSLISPNITLTLTLSRADVDKAYQEALKRLSQRVSAPGFRKGKVPTAVAEEKIGRAHLVEHVLDDLLPAAYRAAVEKSGKKPITRPEFSVVSADEGKDWVIEAQFAQLPTVTLGKYQTYVAAGLKAAEKTLAEQKKAAQKDTKDTKPAAAAPEQEKEVKLQHIFRELVTQIKPQIPELLLKHETQHEFEHMASQLKQLGISVDSYLERRKMNMEQLSQELAVSTLNRLQLDLILGAIAKEKKLVVTPADRDAYFSQIKDEKQRQELQKDEHYLGHLDTNLTRQKVVDFLLAA
jgi:FKBP-type peptidyl-prolyl cis-trans isomerase (trigger factor)